MLVSINKINKRLARFNIISDSVIYGYLSPVFKHRMKSLLYKTLVSKRPVTLLVRVLDGMLVLKVCVQNNHFDIWLENCSFLNMFLYQADRVTDAKMLLSAMRYLIFKSSDIFLKLGCFVYLELRQSIFPILSSIYLFFFCVPYILLPCDLSSFC